MTSPASQARTLLLTVIGAVVLWGGYQAVGAYQAKHDFRQAAVVIVCFSLFLGTWFVLMALRNRRVARQKRQRETDSEGTLGMQQDTRESGEP